MRLVIGAFTTLAEAENAVRALLDAGHAPEEISTHGRVGGGRVRLGGVVPLQPVADPARLVSRAERARAWAAAGGVLGALLALGALMAAQFAGLEALDEVQELLGTWQTTVIGVLLTAAAGAALAAVTRRTDGLPHDLAMRYGMRLDQGDLIVSVRVSPGDQARAAQELLGLHGAIFAHVTRGAVEPLGDVSMLSTLAPSEH